MESTLYMKRVMTTLTYNPKFVKTAELHEIDR